MADPIDVPVKITGDAASGVAAIEETEAALKGLGDTSDKTTAKVKAGAKARTSAEQEAAKAVKASQQDNLNGYEALSKAIDEEKAKLAGLKSEFATSTGDNSGIFGNIKQSEADLKNLMGVASSVGLQFGTEVDKAGTDVSDFDRLVRSSLQDSETAFQTLTRVIGDTRNQVKSLQDSYRSSGSASILGDLTKTKADLTSLLGIADSMGGEFKTGGEEAGQSFMSGFSDLFSGGLMSQGTAAIAAYLAPMIATTVATAVTTGFGLGITGLGIMAVKNNLQVVAAFAGLKTEASTVFTGAASSFIEPLTGGLQDLKTDLSGMKGELSDVFSPLAGSLRPLLDAFGTAAKDALPGFVTAARDAVPVVEALANDMPAFGAAFGQFFSILAGTPGQVSMLNVGMAALDGILTGTALTLRVLGTVAQPFVQNINSGVQAVQDLTQALGSNGGATKDFMQQLIPLIPELQDTEEHGHDAGAALAYFTTELQAATNAAEASDDALLSLDKAHTAFTDGITKGKKAWDEDTKAGEANVTLLDTNTEALTKRYDLISGGLPLSAKQSQAELNLATNLYNSAKAAGASKDELATLKGVIDSLTASLDKVPTVKTINFTLNEKVATRFVTEGDLNPATFYHGTNFANSGIAGFANSGVNGSMPHYDVGGVYAGGNAPLYRFAEQSTGREGLIAQKGDKNRAMATLRETAGWFDGSVNFPSGSSTGGASGGGDGGMYGVANVYLDSKILARGLIQPVNRMNGRSSVSIYSNTGH